MHLGLISNEANVMALHKKQQQQLLQQQQRQQQQQQQRQQQQLQQQQLQQQQLQQQQLQQQQQQKKKVVDATTFNIDDLVSNPPAAKVAKATPQAPPPMPALVHSNLMQLLNDPTKKQRTSGGGGGGLGPHLGNTSLVSSSVKSSNSQLFKSSSSSANSHSTSSSSSSAIPLTFNNSIKEVMALAAANAAKKAKEAESRVLKQPDVTITSKLSSKNMSSTQRALSSTARLPAHSLQSLWEAATASSSKVSVAPKVKQTCDSEIVL
jgi:hypothetical protein